MVVLIPAYCPGRTLPDLVTALRSRRPGLDVLVVDDGSGPLHHDAIEAARAAGARITVHPVNRGKGAALRTGFALARELYPGQPVVCADADGQHAVDDVLAVLDACTDSGTMVLGVRALDQDVPLRSRVGNVVTSRLFRLATGRPLSDTQTGLRAYPPHLLDWLTTVPGDRYEYELSLLLRATRRGLAWRTVPIRTIYADGNATSHFRPLADSARIYLPLLAFAASSLLAFGVDTAALLGLHALTGSLGLSVVGARVLSAATNFAINRRVVFRRGRSTPLWRAAARYLLLAGFVLGAGYLLLRGLTDVGIPLLAAKIVTDLTLFVLSYAVQRRVVFDGTDPADDEADALSPTSQTTPSLTAGP